MRRPFVMFLFQVKTKIQYQLEEYIEWKSRFSTRSASDHKEVLVYFIKKFKYKDIKEVDLNIIKQFRLELTNTSSRYTTHKAMQALRCFSRYYKKQISYNPESIKDDQIVEIPTNLPVVEGSDSIKPMKDKLLGRPPKVALIKAVKELRDDKKMSFRAIARELNKDVSQVYVWYKYEIPAILLRK